MIRHPHRDLYRPLRPPRPPRITQVTSPEVGHRPLRSRLNRTHVRHRPSRENTSLFLGAGSDAEPVPGVSHLPRNRNTKPRQREHDSTQPLALTRHPPTPVPPSPAPTNHHFCKIVGHDKGSDPRPTPRGGRLNPRGGAVSKRRILRTISGSEEAYCRQ